MGLDPPQTLQSREIQRIFHCIHKMEDLKKQATVERSHYYVADVITDAITLLYSYAAIYGEQENDN